MKYPLMTLTLSHSLKIWGAYCVSATVLRAKEPKINENSLQGTCSPSEEQIFQCSMIQGLRDKIEQYSKRGMGATSGRKVCLRKASQRRRYLRLGIEKQARAGGVPGRETTMEKHIEMWSNVKREPWVSWEDLAEGACGKPDQCQAMPSLWSIQKWELLTASTRGAIRGLPSWKLTSGSGMKDDKSHST